MCLLVLFYRVVDDAPLIVGANREEAYARPARSVAGIDVLAGGTWLGVNDRGMVAAVTNRRKSRLPPQPRSRGLLTRDMLGCTSTKAALACATAELDSGRYAGCNVVCADAGGVTVFQAGDWLRVNPLPPGIHVLTNHDINDAFDPRLVYARDWLHGRDYDSADDCLDALRQLCPQTGGEHPAICLRGDGRGTVSSSLLILRPKLEDSTYLHAHGPPDVTEYEDYSHLLQEIAR